MPSYTIYSLDHPETNIPFYVGITAMSLKNRLGNHVSFQKTCNYPIYRYMDSLPATPNISTLDEVEHLEGALALEGFWMEQLRQWGFALYNTKGIFHRNRYIRTKDETSYEAYARSKEKIPKKYLWVREWEKHPLHPSKHIIPPHDAVYVRQKIRQEYRNKINNL